jgi:thioredoxin reductase
MLQAGWSRVRFPMMALEDKNTGTHRNRKIFGRGVFYEVGFVSNTQVLKENKTITSSQNFLFGTVSHARTNISVP